MISFYRMWSWFTLSPYYTIHFSVYVISSISPFQYDWCWHSLATIIYYLNLSPVKWISYYTLCYCVEWLTLIYIYVKYYSELIFNIPLCTSKLCAVDISNSFLWYDLPLCEFWVPVCYSCIEGWCGILQICRVCTSILYRCR